MYVCIYMCIYIYIYIYILCIVYWVRHDWYHIIGCICMTSTIAWFARCGTGTGTRPSSPTSTERRPRVGVRTAYKSTNLLILVMCEHWLILYHVIYIYIERERERDTNYIHTYNHNYNNNNNNEYYYYYYCYYHDYYYKYLLSNSFVYGHFRNQESGISGLWCEHVLNSKGWNS